MKAQQLKSAILQLAIQGKLVPQNPNDEPASVLFEKIQAEKEKLIAEGKIKKTKKTSDKCSLDVEVDFPFEIPNSWVWVRLEDVCEFNPLSSIEGIDIAFGSWVLDLEDIEKNTGFLLQKKIKSSDNIKSQKNTFNKDYVLYGKLRPYLNKVIISDDNGFCSTEILPIRTKDYLFNKYLQAYLMSPYFLDYARNDSYGTKMPRLNITNFKLQQFPLPPLNEQKRIVAKIEELLPFIDEYDKKEQKLTTLNQQFPDQLKKSILQAAIQGQLVAQDLNDEPASELIKRIQAEKERLISEKKIKKPKVKSEIAVRNGLPYEIINGVERCIADELPFEIPESWCWVRLGDIFEINSGLTFSKADLISKNIDSVRVLRGGNIKDSNINLLDNDLYLSKAKIKNDEYYLREFDILTPSVTSLENVGKFGLYREEGGKASFGGFVFCLRSLTKVSENNIFYIFYILQSGYIISKMKSLTRKSGQAFYNLGKENFKQILIPIPPLNEQKRIVRKIEEVFSHIQSL